MRLNRKWLYLGGLITILTLLLTLTWALPAGAVGQLDDGTLSTERSAVNPDPGDNEDPDANLTKVTLTNAALDKTSTVVDDGDFGPVFLAFKGEGVNVVNNRVIRVNIMAGTTNLGNRVGVKLMDGDKEVTPDTSDSPWGVANINLVLPITSDVSIDGTKGTDDIADKVDSIFVINAATGVIEFTLNADIKGGEEIYLSYNTSPQETALVNVAGDNANFDLLAVERVTTPGEYAASFVTRESLTMNTSTGIVDEQHSVPSGLRGFVVFEREEVTDRYQTKSLELDAHADGQGASVDADSERDSLVGKEADGPKFFVQVANPPIRNLAVTKDGTYFPITDDMKNVDSRESGVAVVAVDGIKGIVELQVTSGEVDPDEVIELTYTGSDDFFIEVDHGPIQKQNTTLLGKNTVDQHFVVPSTTDADVSASTVFQVVSIGDGEDSSPACSQCRVRIGVITGNTHDAKEPTPLSSRISVLGISYNGSEREPLPTNAEKGETFNISLDFEPTDMNAMDGVQHDIAIADAGSKPVEQPPVDVFTVTRNTADNGYNVTGDYNSAGATTVPDTTNEAGKPFVITLKNPPVDRNEDDDINKEDVTVTSTGTIGVTATGLLGKKLTLSIGTAMKVEDTITVTYAVKDDSKEIRSLDKADFEATITVVGTLATFTLKATAPAVLENGYIDVTYTRGVGALPQNALKSDLGKNDAPPEIAVSAGSRATIISGNDRITVDAEEDGPTFSNQSPGESAGVATATATLSIDVNDEVSGVDMESIALSLKVGTTVYPVANADLTITASGAGYRATINLNEVKTGVGNQTLSIDATGNTPIQWWASAEDIAGNYDRSDADAKTKTVNEDYTFKVDGVKAKIDSVYTGDWFDQADEEVKGDRLLSQGERMDGASDTTSVRVVFSETMDGSTIDIDGSDFTVDGAAPVAANWYSEVGQSVFLTVAPMEANATPLVAIVGSVSDKAGNATTTGSKAARDGIAPTPTLSVDRSSSDQKVIVTVTSDERIRTLTPTLELFIADALEKGIAALNEVDVFTVGLEDADDPDSPLVLRDASGSEVARGFPTDRTKAGDEPFALTLTLSRAPILDMSTGMVGGDVDNADISVSRKGAFNPVEKATDAIVSAANGEIALELSSVSGVVAAGDTITVTYRGTAPDPATAVGVSRPSGKQVSATSWTFDISISRDDRYAVTATVEDASRNEGTGGSKDANAANATVFEIDSKLAGGGDPTTGDITNDPSGNRPVSISEPFFIELTWDGEGSEYPGDSGSAVTLTKVELDGTDVSGSAVAQNNHSYRLSITGISLGAHTLTYNAEDAQGNTHLTDRVLKFTVQPVPTWDLPLNAGMNLVSVPSAPANGDVNELFGDVEQIDLIFTFEDGQSLVALRSQDSGEFVGTLKTIDSQHAYWVSVSNAVTVPISIPPTSQLAPPPYITVMGGQWNLVPVISLGAVDDDTVDVGAAPGTEINADTYLGDFRTAFGWGGSSWQKIDPAEGTDADPSDVVVVGKGYWVLYDENAIITP